MYTPYTSQYPKFFILYSRPNHSFLSGEVNGLQRKVSFTFMFYIILIHKGRLVQM